MLGAVNDLPAPIGAPLRAVMQIGTLWAGLALSALVVWLAPVRVRVQGGLGVLLAALVAYRIDNVLKAVIDRPRPPGLVEGLSVREQVDGFGFPSGHTTMAFALASAIHHVVPRRWRWLPWVLAALVGAGRMHVGVHWPADVAGGAALGTAVGAAAWLLVASVRGGGRYRRSP